MKKIRNTISSKNQILSSVPRSFFQLLKTRSKALSLSKILIMKTSGFNNVVIYELSDNDLLQGVRNILLYDSRETLGTNTSRYILSFGPDTLENCWRLLFLFNMTENNQTVFFNLHGLYKGDVNATVISLLSGTDFDNDDPRVFIKMYYKGEPTDTNGRVNICKGSALVYKTNFKIEIRAESIDVLQPRIIINLLSDKVDVS